MALTDTGSAGLSFIRGAGANGSGAPPTTTPNFLTLPFTSESLTEKLTSASSAAMRDDRQFAGTRLVRGESAGDVGLEMAYGLWFDEIISGVLQSGAVFPPNPVSTDSDSMTNGKTKTFFVFEKKLEAETGFQYTRFQDCQIGTLSIDVQANSLANMSMSVTGLQSFNDTIPLTGATYTQYDLTDQMDTNSAVLEFRDINDTPIDATVQSMSLALDNQLRGQQAVGHFYNAGNASGRFKCTITASIYFRSMVLYEKFKTNAGIKVFLTLLDSAGNYYKFAMEYVNVTSHEVAAGGADQDLVASVELQALPAASAGNKTLTVTRYTA